jgi:hypothetical protein
MVMRQCLAAGGGEAICGRAVRTASNGLRTGLYLQPQMWIMVSGWVWRKVKKMIESGEGREKVVNFIGSAMVSYVGLDGEFRRDFEEPHRLLSFF